MCRWRFRGCVFPPIPIELHRDPLGLGVLQTFVEFGLALAFFRFCAWFALGLLGWGVKQSGIQAQARDQCHLDMLALTVLNQGHSSKGTVSDHDNFPFWMPATHLAEQSSRTRHTGAVALAQLGTRLGR